MDNLRCPEYLSESPSTSSSINATSLVVSQNRRRSGKIVEHHRTSDVTRLVLGQLPTNRKRPAPAEKLNNSQFPSVPPLKDRAIHQDSRSLDTLFKCQNLIAFPKNYFMEMEAQITPKQRHQAMEWLYDVCKEVNCEPGVFPLAVSYVDRFLNVQSINRDYLQILASVCLFIASKVKAPEPLNAKDIAYFTDGGVSCQQILSWELIVLAKLNWDVSTATALDFLDQVSVRYAPLHYLTDACREIIHRIQLG
uniref:Cyclin N-terminal domain-containing protein n=1 Tax=Syphacia muris TaxID=451379 RepID=A0A0N5AIE5_9BILA